MATTREMREGIAAVLQAAFPDVNVYAMVPGDMVTPAAIVISGPKQYDLAMGHSFAQHEFTVMVIASRVDQGAGQEVLDDMSDAEGDRSVKAAFDANPSLDGLIPMTLSVTGSSGNGSVSFAGIDYMKTDFTISITA